MPLEPKQLDDRQFDDLLAEAKLRLQRYCPEWTDFNESDPGIALVQLFAWLTELMLYRINQIPERNYISFLKLLKLERREARPARTQVVMTVSATATKPIIKTVKNRSKYFVTTDSGDALTFETVEALDLVPYPMDAVQVFDGLQYEDHSQANRTGTQSFRPLGWTPQLSNALYLGFHPDQSSLENAAVFPERMVLCFFFPPGRRTVVLNDQTTPSGQSLPNLVWEYQSKLDVLNDAPFDPDRWRPLTVIEDSTRSLTRQGRVVLRGPGEDGLASPSPKPSDTDLRYWIRCRLVGGIYAKEDIPEVAFLRCNAVEVENRSTIENEFVGQGDGTNGEFQLRNRPVDPDSLNLVLVGDLDGVEQPCIAKDNLYLSGADDLHFTLNPNTGEIHFGNGKQGRIPGAGETLIAKSYLAGGGANGNIRADTIKDPPLGVSGLESVSNPRPAVGGMDEETLAELIERAPRVLRGDARAVTKDDFRRFAEETPGVGRAIVLPQRLQRHPGLQIPGAISVVIIPKVPIQDLAGQGGPPKYIPPTELLDAVSRRLEEIKPAGTELEIAEPRLRSLELQVTIKPAPGITEAQAKTHVKQAIEHYFQPVENASIRPLVDPDTHLRPQPPAPRWEVETPIYPSRIYEVLFAARDPDSEKTLVQDVAELTLKDAGRKVELGSVLQLDKDELPNVYVSVQIASEKPARCV